MRVIVGGSRSGSNCGPESERVAGLERGVGTGAGSCAGAVAGVEPEAKAWAYA